MEEKVRMSAEWIDSPKSEFPLALELIKTSKNGGLYLKVPETNGFPANRFEGRLLGYMYAVVAERIKPKEKIGINIDTIRPYAFVGELEAFEKLQMKIKEQSEKGISPFDDGYIGRLEGIAVYFGDMDLSLLYSEIDIDLNRGCDANGIPSYAYHSSHLKAGFQLVQCDRSRQEVIQILKKDGLKEKGAAMITDRMILVVKQQRKKSAIKTILVGSIIFIIGMIITGVTHRIAESNGGGRYILAWGALGCGGFYALLGVIRYIKALFYNGKTSR